MLQNKKTAMADWLLRLCALPSKEAQLKAILYIYTYVHSVYVYIPRNKKIMQQN